MWRILVLERSPLFSRSHRHTLPHIAHEPDTHASSRKHAGNAGAVTSLLTEAKKNMAAESAKRLQVHHLENRNAEEAQADPLEALETMEDVGGIKQRLKVDT
jgi:hypothetical protein